MNSKESSVRPLGQRSITSTFLFRSTNRTNDCKKDVNVKSSNERGSKISLSEYLSRKLQRSSVLPRSLLGKERPFVLPIAREDVNSHGKEDIVGKERGEEDKGLALHIILQQFKDTKREKENVNASAPHELVCGSTEDKVESRKRIRVLGDDSEPERRRVKTLSREEEQTPLFNHYANGGGWWDCGMEGVDNDEVGCSDMWEGMGSTNLGGLDWH